MADTDSTDDLRAVSLSSMGAELGSFYYAQWKEVSWAHAKWNQYRQLYAESPETLELLNRTAGFPDYA